MSRRQTLMAVITTISIAGGSLFGVAGPAMAGGGGPLDARAILRASLLSSAARGSFHLRGAAVASASSSKGQFHISVVVAAARFHGDVASRGGRGELHLRGQVTLLNRARYFHLAEDHRVVAAKLGKAAWKCTRIPAATALRGPALRLVKPIRAFARGLERKARLANLGLTTLGGAAVWHLRASLVTRLDLAKLFRLASMGSGVMPIVMPIVPHAKGVLAGLPKAPKPWLRVRANFWVSQRDFTLIQMALRLRVRTNSGTLELRLGLRLSRYGEAVKVKLPRACTAAHVPA